MTAPIAPAAAVRGVAALPGTARGRLMKLDTVSFWGGVDPATGLLTDPSIAHCGESVAGRVLWIAEPRGSSSSSAVMLELLAEGRAPAALLLGRIDAILGLGIVVAREMGHAPIPLLTVDPAAMAALGDGAMVAVRLDGTVHVERYGL